MVISVVFDGWGLGNVLVMGVAIVIKRGDNNALSVNIECGSSARDKAEFVEMFLPRLLITSATRIT